MKKTVLCSIVLAAVCVVIVQEASAAEADANRQTVYLSFSNEMVGVGSTRVDYSTQFYYNMYISASLWDGFDPAWGQMWTSNETYIQAEAILPYNANREYDTDGIHYC